MVQIPNESCATRIKKALSIRNMKQSELCEKTKISKSVLSEYISGVYEPKQDRLLILAEALRVDPVWLMGFDVPMEKEKEKEKTPSKDDLTEGEMAMLKLFRQIPVERQPEALDLLRVALKMQQRP